ncbi:MAG: hypothetical protein FWH20_07460 [Oscillospiraceae bacterium]|nr:hypothetical protein [Oscillospiraceae bacterium]
MQRALDSWGFEPQFGVAVEECAELIVALQKYVNRSIKPSKDELLDEIADVEMMLAQVRLALKLDDELLRKRIDSKFEKLSKYF